MPFKSISPVSFALVFVLPQDRSVPSAVTSPHIECHSAAWLKTIAFFQILTAPFIRTGLMLNLLMSCPF